MSRFQRVAGIVAAVILAGGVAAAWAGETETVYMAMFMDGKKVGYARNTRAVSDGKVTTTQELFMNISRGDMPLSIHTTDSSVETPDGKPISFKSVQDLGIMAQTIEGVVGADGTVTLKGDDVGGGQPRTMTWPKDALLFEGLHLLEVKKGLAKGTKYTASLFSPGAMRALDVTVTVGDTVETDLLGRVVKLTEVRAVTAGPMGQIDMLGYVDKDHVEQKIVTSLMGMKVEMIACSKQFATSPNDTLDFLDKTLVSCPISLADIVTNQSVTYHLASRDGKPLR
ncbi:MAG TPA: hypothetical protein VM389_07445, partial [Phycisphaerae bacterium]|nr:hypothetical protein [Phycisphaerae bacterium]